MSLVTGEGGTISSTSLVTGEGEEMVQIEARERSSKFARSSWQRSRRAPAAGALAIMFDRILNGRSDLSTASVGSMAVRRT